IVAYLLDRVGWHGVFYGIGGASLLFTLCWSLFYPDKRIGVPTLPSGRRQKVGVARVPLSVLLRYRSTWGIAFGQMGNLYAYFFFMSWLPGYLILEKKMSVLKTGIVAS